MMIAEVEDVIAHKNEVFQNILFKNFLFTTHLLF